MESAFSSHEGPRFSGCRELFVPNARVGQNTNTGFGRRRHTEGKERSVCLQVRASPGQCLHYSSSEYKGLLVAPAQGQSRESPLSVYEMHLGSWKFHENENRSLGYLELADCLPRYLKDLGFSHVEFLPPSEYPFGASWGYQVTGFYAPTHRYGSPEDFKVLVDACKDSDIGVLLDWVPAISRPMNLLWRISTAPVCSSIRIPGGRHAEWDTLIFNYGRPEVRVF